MNEEARKSAITWLLKQLEVGISRFRDAEVQAELVKEKINYQRELKEMESAPRQAQLFTVIDPSEEALRAAEE